MCGICGWTGGRQPGLMDRMLRSMRHRGPDDAGAYAGTAVQLGMVRLAVIDIADGRQPMANEDGAVQVVFNGEIYNFAELREELEQKGHQFRTRCDTEVIAHAYEEYGPDMAHRLNGMFAIAVWDRARETLHLFRDRYGIKPLFFSAKDGQLVFASEIKALLCHPQMSRELNPQAVSHYFALRNVPAPLSIYKDIGCLLPGERLAWKRGRLTVEQWYRLSMRPRWDVSDAEELVERLDVLLRDSVKLRMRADVPFGAYLSGGLDSSMVVAIMSEYAPRPVKTFTLGYADAPAHKQDARYARTVAERYGTEHLEYAMDWRELQDELPRVVGHLDQPFAGVIASYWLSRFMRRHVTVALSGDGADDLFASYGHHRLVWPTETVRRALARGEEVTPDMMGAYADQGAVIRDFAARAPWEARLRFGAFMEHEKAQFLSARGKELLRAHDTPSFLEGIYNRADPRTDALNKMLYLDIHTLLPNEILYFNDMLSMAHSLEVRTPFLDYRLVELACAIPGALKIRGATLKYILRRLGEKYVPQEILQRPKEGFVLPKNTWLRQGMSRFARDTLSPERMRVHGYFDPAAVQSLLDRFLAGEEILTFRLWTLMVFQIWCESALRK